MADDNQSSDCDSDVGDGGDSSGHGSGMVTGNGFSGGMWRPSVQPADPCYRCGKRVYPVERVDVGVLFHRRCFRCRVCGLQLSLRSFHWDQGTPASSGSQTGQGPKQGQGQADVQGRGTAANVGDFLLKHGSPPHGNGLLYNQNGGSEIGSNVKDVRDHGHSSRSFSADVYCNVHVPRAVGRIDGEAVGIKQALAAPRRGAETCDQLPLNAQQLPLNAQLLPLNAQQLPLNAQQLPLNAQLLPLNAQQLVLNAQQLPLNAQLLPLNAQQLVLNAQQLPLNAQLLPLNAQQLPLNAQQLVLNAQQLPLNAQQLVLNAQQLPLNAQQLPLNAQQLVLNAQLLPLNAQQLPLNVQQLPLNAQQLPLNAQLLPLNAQQLVLNAQQLVLNAQQLPLNAQLLPLNAQQLPLNTQQLPLNAQLLPPNAKHNPFHSIWTSRFSNTRGSVYNPGWQYDANALEFAHYREIFRRGKQKTCTGTYKDFEDSGVFAAQTALEALQKAEEDRLYAEIRAERERRVRRLEDELQHEMETTVRDLVNTFERFSPQRGKTKLQRETERIEEQYRRKKEEKVRKMLERLSSEQRARVASLIQKHSQQMLELIAEKLTSLEERSSSESDSRSPVMDLSRPPPVSPPEFKRVQLFKSPAEFAKLDNHVFEVASRHYSTFTELVKDLIVTCETDLEKARAIFRWVTLTDLNELDVAETVCPESPLGLLRGIKFGTETYHDLCRRLCSYAGLHCEVIQGYSKGAGYRPGMKLDGNRFRNSWTAVCMDGSWCFLNCNWGARHVRGASQESSSSNNNSGSTGSSHHSSQGGHGRRRRGSCAKENVDCRVSCGSAGSDASSVPDDVIRDHQQQNNRVIVTTTAQSCLDSRFITDSSDVDQSSDHSLIRNSREKDSPLRQLFRYASGEVLTARNGDRSSSASAQSSDRTSTGSTTTTSSLGKNDGGQSDSNGSSSGSDRGKGNPSNRSRGQNGVSGCGNGSRGESAGSAASKEGQGERDQGQQYHYQCDEFYFITDPEDHIFQHFPDDPEWQLLECPISLSEFINLPVLKSPFFNFGLKLATHYDCKQVTEGGVVSITLRIPHLLGFGYTLEPKDKRMNPYILEGRVMLRIVGHKAIFTIAPPKRGRYYFTIYAKDDWLSESLQSACAFQIRCKEGRECLRSPYPKVSFFGPTPSMALYGLLPQTHIDPVVSYSHDDVSFQFQLPLHVRLSYSLQFHGQAPDAVDADFQRYVFLRHRDDNSISFLVRCPHVGKYVFALYGSKADSPDESAGLTSNPTVQPYDCLYRYLIECKQSATNKAPFPRACHRWFQSHLLEPLVGDLETDQRITFRVRTPLASDVALLMGDAWYHFRLLHEHIWEATLITSKASCPAKLYARLNKDTSRFSPLLEFQIVSNT